MFLSKLSINRPVLSTVLILVFIIFGALSYTRLNLNENPEVDIPFITIQTIYPGAGPKEIEVQISKKLEDAVATVSQIKRLESYSLDGISIVMIEFDMSKDLEVANNEVKSKVDQILNELPDDAELPLVQKVDLGEIPIIDVVLSSDNASPIELYEFANNVLKDRFSQIKGVGLVNITGGQEREIKIQMDDRTVYENMISLPQMLQIIASQNVDLPSGYFNQGGQEYTVRSVGEFEDLETIEELEIPTAFGPKKIRQIADVVDGGKKVRQRAIFFDNETKKNYKNVVRLSLIKSSEGNAVEISELIDKELPVLNELVPAGMNLDKVNDTSNFTRAAVEDTVSNVLLGVLFTSIVLFVFLHEWRSTLIVALSMPTSIISTFLLVELAGFSLNTLSLLGISVSVGVLVSNSIVVLENIFRYKSMGYSKKESADKGTSEIAVAVVAATLTNIVVFVPLGSLQSLVGEFLRELAYTAAFATIFSLLISFTLTPMLSSLILPKEMKDGAISRALIKWEKLWERIYEGALKIVLKNKFISILVVVVSILSVVVTLGIYGDKIGSDFLPATDNGKIQVQVELPQGYNLDETGEVVDKIVQKVREFEDVELVLANLGKLSDLDFGTNLASVEVNLVDAKLRETSLFDYIPQFTKELSNIPNAKIIVSQLQSGAGPEAPIEFFLMGQDEEVLEKYKNEIMDKTDNIKGLINFTNSSKPGKPEITISPKRDKMSEVGLSSQELAITLRSAIEGIVSSTFKEQGEEYDIAITLDENSTNSPEKIENLPIVTMAGNFRLSQVADVGFTEGFSKILHRDKFTAIKFTGYNDQSTPPGDIIADVDEAIATIDLPDGYRVMWSGASELQQEMMMDLGFAMLLAIILTYLLLAAILESFGQPIIIMFTVVFSLIGVFISLYYTNTNLGITSMMGIIMLIGIVVNNGILLLDYTNILRREEGMKPKDAMIKAAPTKLKAIIMATVAIILGMLPVALGIGDAGAEVRQPLGIVSIGGLTTSTFLSLFVVPALYYIFSFSKSTKKVETV